MSSFHQTQVHFDHIEGKTVKGVGRGPNCRLIAFEDGSVACLGLYFWEEDGDVALADIPYVPGMMGGAEVSSGLMTREERDKLRAEQLIKDRAREYDEMWEEYLRLKKMFEPEEEK